MSAQNAYSDLMKTIQAFQNMVELDDTSQKLFNDIKASVQAFKNAATAAYWEQKNEIQTLNRVVDTVQASDVAFYIQQNIKQSQDHYYMQAERLPKFIRLGRYILPLKDYKGFDIETGIVRFGKAYYQLGDSAKQHLLSTIYPCLAQRNAKLIVDKPKQLKSNER